jgi:hypothetical protein
MHVFMGGKYVKKSWALAVKEYLNCITLHVYLYVCIISGILKYLYKNTSKYIYTCIYTGNKLRYYVLKLYENTQIELIYMSIYMHMYMCVYIYMYVYIYILHIRIFISI